MSRSHLPHVIFICLARPGSSIPAVIGSDAIFYVDGRKRLDTIINEVYQRYSSYFDKGYTLLGYERPRDYSGTIYHF